MKDMKLSVAIIIIMILFIGWWVVPGCQPAAGKDARGASKLAARESKPAMTIPDTAAIPNDKFGEEIRYGRQLMLNTAYYIGPEGVAGRYLGNKMNCTNCHQDAGTKPYSFNLLASHDSYPQYRAREGKILTLAERVNNCIQHPHNGKPLPLDSREMVAILSYLKWINGFAPKAANFEGKQNLTVDLPAAAASPERGRDIFMQDCARCHGKDGEGQFNARQSTYVYPPLWGSQTYQPGSSMHRIIKMARWLKGNMPFDKTVVGKPFLTDAQALDVAAFINDDAIHQRPQPKAFEYPESVLKPIDYDRAPFSDSFSIAQHKYGPYQPIIEYRKAKGMPVDY
jgi:thiosulfate dehydrogenase